MADSVENAEVEQLRLESVLVILKLVNWVYQELYVKIYDKKYIREGSTGESALFSSI